MPAPYIRILVRDQSGEVRDTENEFGLPDFGGMIPSAGDKILDPGVPGGRSRTTPANRTMWTVIGRVFNARDSQDTVALIVTESTPGTADGALLPT